MTLAGGICGGALRPPAHRAWPPRVDEPAAHRAVLRGWDLGVAAALRQAWRARGHARRSRRRRSSTATRRPTAGVLAARPGGRPALARRRRRRSIGPTWRPTSGSPTPASRARQRRRADRRARRRRSPAAADGRVGDPLRRARRLVGADQHAAVGARGPAGRGVRRVRRDGAARRRGAVPGDRHPDRHRRAAASGRVRCRRSASTPPRSSPSSATAPPRSPPSRRPDRSPSECFLRPRVCCGEAPRHTLGSRCGSAST